MWEQIINCLTKGGSGNSKKCQFLNLSELYKRCPPNQRKHFALFKKKNEEYKERLQKYPDSMPKINWKYYEANVRPEYVAWVKRFQDQYEQFDTFFENRHTLIDPSKYFCEVEEEMKEVTKQVELYKKESNERIKVLEEELKFLGDLKPYQEMTMEEFCYAKPNLAPDFINKPTFWPHTPEEQKPGPQEEVHVEAGEEFQAAMVKPTDDGGPKGGEPPKTAPPAAGTPKKSSTSPTDQKSEAKKDLQPETDGKNRAIADSETKVDQVSCQGESKAITATKTKDQQSENPIDVEKLKETASELAVKGSKLAVDLAKKASILLKSLVEKFNAKRKEVEIAANKAREENKAKSEKQAVKEVSSIDASKATVDPKEVDSINFREGSKNICHQTIIKGDDQANADVKPKHANLNEEVEAEEVVEETEERYKQKSSPLKTNDSKAIIEKMKSESIKPEKTLEKDKKSESSKTKDICQQACEIMTKEKPPDEGPCDSEKEEEPSENEDSKKKKCLTKTKQDQKSKETPKVDEQKFLEENAKKCVESQTNLKKSWEENKDPVDVVGRPKTTSKPKPTDDSKTNEKAFLSSDFQTEGLENKVFMGFKPNASDKPNESMKDEKKLASLGESAKKTSIKEATEDPAKLVYPDTRKTHDLGKDIAEPQKAKNKLHLSEEFEQKQTEDAKLKEAENETNRKTEETEKKPTNAENLSPTPNEKSQSKPKVEAEKVTDPTTTFYPKLVINAKPKAKSNSLESPTEKPPAPPAKDSPSTPEAFIPRTSTAPAAPSTPPKVIKPPEVLESAQEMAKKVFKMATDAAALLSDASNAVECAKKAKTNRIESLEAAYLAAQKQANRALSEAYKAMGAAKKLTKRQQNRDPDALVMAEKHAVLAKLLARRAIALKKEIETILEELKKKQ
ncbi:neurofilament heavy polypeptide isoform X2 [Drosophila tropicalis]|uniref:neurofilament heavy polypeptide isoform X2 n=1 Tax=Drosophila tropicalis TaxID=46794 RepID=UPI0035ABE0E3